MKPKANHPWLARWKQQPKKADGTYPLKCDECGRFIAWDDLVAGLAYRELDTPDSHFTAESYTTLCKKHRP